ncbi:MAG: Holliday junction resolvase RuvX [Oceanococcus sp.]
MSRVALGFDFGSKRIGLAIGNDTTGTSRALGWLNSPSNDDQWQAVDKAVAQWRPTLLIVGTPFTEDGGKQTMTRKARHFAHQLRDRFHLPVEEVDERYSSTSAEAELVDARQHGGKKRLQRGDCDSLAAALIVQQWLDSA